MDKKSPPPPPPAAARPPTLPACRTLLPPSARPPTPACLPHPASPCRPPTHPCLPHPACRLSLALVCKRFHQVLYSDAAAFWRSFSLDSSVLAPLNPAQRREWAATRLAQLARVSGLVSDIFVREMGGTLLAAAAASAPGWQVSHLFEALQPAVVDSVGLALNPFSLPPHELRGLARFPRLASLQISTMHLPEAAAEALATLTTLRSLRCRAAAMPGAGVASAAQLSLLTRLELESHQPLPQQPAEASVQQLTALRSLQQLLLSSGEAPQHGQGLEVPAPADFPSLKQFQLTCPPGLQVSSVRVCVAWLLAGRRRAVGASDQRWRWPRWQALILLCCLPRVASATVADCWLPAAELHLGGP